MELMQTELKTLTPKSQAVAFSKVALMKASLTILS